MKTQICPQCNKSFNTVQQHVKYCSQKCYAAYKKSHPKSENTFTCHTCGIVFYKSRSLVKGKEHFCSGKCYGKYKATLTPHNYIETDTILDSLRKAFVINNKPYMFSTEYDTIRKIENLPSALVTLRRFKTWKNALIEAKLPTRLPDNLFAMQVKSKDNSDSKLQKNIVFCTREEVISDLIKVATLMGQTPTCVAYNKHGKYTWHTASKAITGKNNKWANTCVEAGLLPHTTHEGNGEGKSVEYTTPSGNVVTLQSSYEMRFANTLNRFGLFWLCHRELENPIKFTNSKGITGKYRPDFYIPSKDIYLDTKGWYRPKDRSKMKIVRACNRDKTVYIVFKEAIALSEKSETFDSWLEEAIKLNIVEL